MPDENQNLTPPNPQTLVRQPPVPLTDPLRDQTQAKGQSSLAGADADDSPTNLFWARFWRVTRKVALYGSPLWTLLIADIDHIGLVREVLIIGVTEQSSAAGAGGIRMILGQYQTGAGCAGHAAKAVSQIENVVLGPCQGVVDILTGA